MITNDPVLARQAQDAGIERIFVDLEQMGKKERQGHLDTLISSHSLEDVIGVKRVLDSSELIVRLNPLHADSGREIEKAIENGADTLMLPMFRKTAEVAEFCARVDGRVSVMPLVETIGAVECLSEVVNLPGVSEIYIGLNDLHLEMGLKFMFEPLADGLLDTMAVIIKRAGLSFGFGGIARVGEGSVPGEMILAEHARLGSSSVILSRTFMRQLASEDEQAFMREVRKLRCAYAELLRRNREQIDKDRAQLVERVKDFVDTKANETSN